MGETERDSESSTAGWYEAIAGISELRAWLYLACPLPSCWIPWRHVLCSGAGTLLGIPENTEGGADPSNRWFQMVPLQVHQPHRVLANDSSHDHGKVGSTKQFLHLCVR